MAKGKKQPRIAVKAGDYVLVGGAVGSIAELGAIQAQAAEAGRALSKRVDEAGRELGTARAAVWKKVEELAAGGLAVVPLDQAAIAERDASVRRAVEADEAARAAS